MEGNSFTVYSETGEIIFNTDENIFHKKNTKKRKIVHAIFDKLRLYNTSPRWDTFLINASHNIFTKGFTFKTDTLIYSIRTKYSFPHVVVCSAEGLENLKTFITNKGIMLDRSCVTSHNEGKAITQWKDFGKLKNDVLEKYVINLSEKRNLSDQQSIILYSTVKIGVASGFLNNTNIVVKDSMITDIIPLEWSDDNNFNINTTNIQIRKVKTKTNHADLSTDNSTTCLSSIKKRNITNIDKKWGKFLQDLYT